MNEDQSRRELAAGFNYTTADSGAVTLIQRFGSALESTLARRGRDGDAVGVHRLRHVLNDPWAEIVEADAKAPLNAATGAFCGHWPY